MTYPRPHSSRVAERDFDSSPSVCACSWSAFREELTGTKEASLSLCSVVSRKGAGNLSQLPFGLFPQLSVPPASLACFPDEK